MTAAPVRVTGAAGRRPPPVPGPVLVRGTGLVGTSIGLGLSRSGVDVLLSDPSPTVQALAVDLGAGREWAGWDRAYGDRTDGDRTQGDRTDWDGAHRDRTHGYGTGRTDRDQAAPAPSSDRPDRHAEPALVVVAAPPDVAAQVVVDALDRFPKAVVTDVASVKATVVAAVRRGAGDRAGRYVGGHPLAGRERSGPVLARGDLFTGRPWVLTPGDDTEPGALSQVRAVVEALGAQCVQLAPDAHDEAVALVSHLPQLLASLVAARLVGAADEHTSLAGQGLRDVTRIAEGDPVLWAQILSSNAAPLASLLAELRADLDAAVAALRALARDVGDSAATESTATPDPAAEGIVAESPAAESPAAESPVIVGPVGASDPEQASLGPRAILAGLIAAGNAGRDLLPGRHGGTREALAVVPVLVPDTPGELARLLLTMGEAGLNLEDLHLEHALGQPRGVAMVSVVPGARERLVAVLRERGWTVVE